MTRSNSGEWRAAIHAALLIGAAAAPVAAFAAPDGITAFGPPCDRPFMLSRTVVRELTGGAAIVATRRYRVTFHRVAEVWELQGELVASEIDVPPALASIAAIERDRRDDGLFPIHLDSTGRIVAAGAAAGLGRETVASALELAKDFAGGAERKAPTAFPDQVQAAAASGGGLTRWPDALFLPHGLGGISEQAFRLPDGGEGSVRIALESDPAPGLATMGRAVRTVTTLAGGTRHVAREEWTLAPVQLTATP
jgi:hypothetical protein